MDNGTVRKFVAARDAVLVDDGLLRRVFDDMIFEFPDAFVNIVADIAAREAPKKLTTVRYDDVRRKNNEVIFSSEGHFRLGSISFMQFQHIYDMIVEDQYVEAIKEVRANIGCCLKEAKDYCEMVRTEYRSEVLDAQ